MERRCFGELSKKHDDDIDNLKVWGQSLRKAHPAVWLVYNMGIIVKTRETLFSVDLCHRRADEIAPLLDFALITHNHTDHYTCRFYETMDRRLRKTVVNNFECNYGARMTPCQKGEPNDFGGGYMRGGKTIY